MVTFYTDENVDGAVIKGLRRKGIDVLTIQEDGRIGLKPDSRVLDRATELGRVLISQDRDLEDEASRRMNEGLPFAGVIFAAKDSRRWGVYIADLELIATLEENEDYRDRLERLPL